MAAHVVLRGKVTGVGFEEFLASYVQRLDLELDVERGETAMFVFDVSGKPELIDMLLTACWLGPRGALVADLSASFSPVDPNQT